MVGGFSIIEVASREEALAWAGKISGVLPVCSRRAREIGYDPES